MRRRDVSELRQAPCPFCGYEHPSLEEEDGWAQVQCDECGARGPVFGDEDETLRERRRQAVCAWNTVAAGNEDAVAPTSARRAASIGASIVPGGAIRVAPALPSEAKMANEVWCVGWRRDENGDRLYPERFCVTASRRKAKDGATNVSTLCGRWVILPTSSEKREPTCQDCLDTLAIIGGNDG